MEIKFKCITKYYGKQCALDNFNTTLTEGIYGILGPNGSGKTTLINIMIGILKANRGSVLLNSIDVRKMGTEYLDKVGYLPQYPTFYKNFRTDEFLEYMCALKNVPNNRIPSRISEVLEQVNLTDVRKKRVGALSGGMKQRLGIAQAILNRPEILVLDEPTVGLDPIERIRFRNIISRLSRDRLVLLATHIVSDVEYIAKEVLILKKGKLVLQGTPEEISKSLTGKVWRVVTSEEELSDWVDRYAICNIKRMGKDFVLRIVCENQPGNIATPVEPGLEDVFLSIFRN
jgi:ABC-2 type transport system ATP-binding protein